MIAMLLSSCVYSLNVFDLIPKEASTTPICNVKRGSSPYKAKASNIHDHGLMAVRPLDGFFDLGGYIGSFDGPDDDDLDGIADYHAIPHFVSFQLNQHLLADGTSKSIKAIKPIRRYEHGGLGFLLNRDTITARGLNDSYIDSNSNIMAGSLILQEHIDRISWESGCNTYFLLNTVPQHKGFNLGVWLASQHLVGAWANRYGKIWVTIGTIVDSDGEYIGGSGEVSVVVPTALFKIVSRFDEFGKIKSMAFLYPQVDASYIGKNGLSKTCNEFMVMDHAQYLTSVSEIELLTGLTFFSDGMNDLLVDGKTTKSGLWHVEESDFAYNCR